MSKTLAAIISLAFLTSCAPFEPDTTPRWNAKIGESLRTAKIAQTKNLGMNNDPLIGMDGRAAAEAINQYYGRDSSSPASTAQNNSQSGSTSVGSGSSWTAINNAGSQVTTSSNHTGITSANTPSNPTNAMTGETYIGTAGGATQPSTGKFFHSVPGGLIDTTNGQHIPTN